MPKKKVIEEQQREIQLLKIATQNMVIALDFLNGFDISSQPEQVRKYITDTVEHARDLLK